MTERASVLHVQPLSQTYAVEIVIASRNFRRCHFLHKRKRTKLARIGVDQRVSVLSYLIANGADIVELLQLLRTRFRQRWDLVHGRSSFHENGPAGSCLAPNIEVRVDAHHECSYCTTYGIIIHQNWSESLKPAAQYLIRRVKSMRRWKIGKFQNRIPPSYRTPWCSTRNRRVFPRMFADVHPTRTACTLPNWLAPARNDIEPTSVYYNCMRSHVISTPKSCSLPSTYLDYNFDGKCGHSQQPCGWRMPRPERDKQQNGCDE